MNTETVVSEWESIYVWIAHAQSFNNTNHEGKQQLLRSIEMGRALQKGALQKWHLISKELWQPDWKEKWWGENWNMLASVW